MPVTRPLILLLVAVATAAPARAQLRGSSDTPPTFSAADRAVIARNELLAAIVDEQPWLVRRALNALAAVKEVDPRADLRQDSPRQASPTGQRRPLQKPEPSANPDLDRLERASPEAMNDLFLLLKQAGERRQRSSR